MSIIQLLQLIATLLTATFQQATRTSLLAKQGFEALLTYTNGKLAQTLAAAKTYADGLLVQVSAMINAAISTEAQNRADAVAGLDTKFTQITDGSTATLNVHNTRINALESGNFGAVEDVVVHTVDKNAAPTTLQAVFLADATAQGITIEENRTYVLMLSGGSGEQSLTFDEPSANGPVSRTELVSAGEKFIIKTDAEGDIAYARYVEDPIWESIEEMTTGLVDVKTAIDGQSAQLQAQNDLLAGVVAQLQGIAAVYGGGGNVPSPNA